MDLLFNYGFVMRKNIYDTLHIRIEENGMPCHSQSKKLKNDGGCEFKIYASDLNVNALEHILRYALDDATFKIATLYEMESMDEDMKEAYNFALLNYRWFIRDEVISCDLTGLRDAKRNQVEAQDKEWWMVWEYMIAARLTRYNALRLVDQLMMKQLFPALNLKF